MQTLQYRFAQDILPVIEPLVGPDGKVTAIDNHLMITATGQQHIMIEQVLAKLDVQRKNLKITVSQDNNTHMNERELGINGQIQIGDKSSSSSRMRNNQSPHLNIRDLGTSRNISGNQFLTVIDGERAFIRVGQAIPYTQQWVSFTQRYLQIQQTTEFREISTGFAVRPKVINKEVELEITPRVMRQNASGAMDFEELRTTVRLQLGEWFDLGGAMQNRDEVSREILGYSRSERSERNVLMIKVE